MIQVTFSLLANKTVTHVDTVRKANQSESYSYNES